MQNSSLLNKRGARSLGTVLCAALLVSLILSLSSILPARAETLGSWNSTTPWENSSSPGITGESCATSSGYIYCVGGFLGESVPQSEVWYAPVSSSGVGTWSSTTSYPTRVDQGSCAISGGYIYCVGGLVDNAGDYTNAVYYAPVSSSGVGTWTLTTAYPIIIEQESCAVSGGYIYCAGGTADDSYPYTPSNAVEYASVSSSGVGTWQTSTLPDVLRGLSCSISSGYMYCVGGDDAVDPYTDLVLYASVSSEGVSTWTATTHYPTDIIDESCGTSSGYLYCVGGFVDGSSFASAVYYAPVSSSGVGTWTSTTSYPGEIYLQSCPIFNGYIYCVGGQNYLGYIQSYVYYSSISGGTSSTTSSTTSTSASTSSTSTSTTSSTSSLGTSSVPACPSVFGGILMPVGAMFTDGQGNTWTAPSGSDGQGGVWSSYFFPGPATSIPAPMQQGWGGDYGTYNGQQGWVVTFYC